MRSTEELQRDLSRVEGLLDYTFTDKKLLLLAFIHRSYFNEHRDISSTHNERLEFLGDAVLGLFISAHLYGALPEAPEGHLSHLRAHLVGAERCAEYTRLLQIDQFLLLGKGEAVNMGRARERLLANLFEAVVGAIFLDGGADAATRFFFRHFSGKVEGALQRPLRNWKADFQNYSQKMFQITPQYIVVEETGPAHSKHFVISAQIGGKEWGLGKGGSKKEAELMAAEDALRKLEEEERERGKD